MKIKEARTQELFLAFKMHFTTEYDFNLYLGRLGTRKYTESIHAKIITDQWQTEENIKKFLLFSFIDYYQINNSVNTYIGNFANKEAFQSIKKVSAMFNTRTYDSKTFLRLFYEEQKSFGKLKDFLLVSDYYYQKKISIYTLSYIMTSLGLEKYWEVDDPLLTDFCLFLKKLGKFINKETENIKNILKEILENI